MLLCGAFIVVPVGGKPPDERPTLYIYRSVIGSIAIKYLKNAGTLQCSVCKKIKKFRASLYFDF